MLTLGAATGIGPETIETLVEAIRQQAGNLSGRSSKWPDGPLSYAWVCCLEAAVRLGQALDAQRCEKHDIAAEELGEAYSAARGAAGTVRFAMFERGKPRVATTR